MTAALFTPSSTALQIKLNAFFCQGKHLQFKLKIVFALVNFIIQTRIEMILHKYMREKCSAT